MDTKSLVEPNSHFVLHVPREYDGSRIDAFITSQFTLYSRSFFTRLIDDGTVELNGKPVTKSGVRVAFGDTVSVRFPAAREVQVDVLKEKAPAIEIVYENPHFLIINKPAGLLVHPTSMKSTAATLVDWLLMNYASIEDVGYVDRPGIVHRLDKDTSGLLIVPRTNYAHGIFADLFRDRKMSKTYYAIVQGHPEKQGVITLPIGRDPILKTKMTSKQFPERSMKVRDATTHYKVLEYFDDAALIEVKPVTGRTHQIRVHFVAIGHPLIGDAVYGKKSKLINRHALHAHNLSFEFEGKQYSFEKSLPEDMNELIKKLRAKTA
ncbi:MAG: hypothetical protein ACD_64C00330G0003 [uncultured bacterium]|nr:MAG: hypothetical protein ACD_64C00330G0003 [uncultured bacterium]HLE76349.1 RluA family pseudouridine synthase [Candidatus Babeliales bacterium]